MSEPFPPVAAPTAPLAREPAEALAALVATSPGVASLSGGAFGEVATYLPGRQVRGIRLTADTVEVHVVAHWGPPLPAVADRVRALCQPLTGRRLINVYIDDLQLPAILTPQG